MTAVLMAALVLGSGLPPAEEPSAVIEGSATWFCGPGSHCTVGFPRGGMYAAAGSELQVPGWRRSFVKVRHGTREVIVQLIDVCLCRGRRIIDLYAEPFSRLAQLSRGVIPVTVEAAGSIARQTLPPTDVADPWSGLWSRRL